MAYLKESSLFLCREAYRWIRDMAILFCFAGMFVNFL
jgi:hypothetical protein